MMSSFQSKRFPGTKSSLGFSLILLSLFMGIALSILPLPLWMKTLWPLWMPLILIFWVSYLPALIHPWLIFLLGLFMDVLQNTYMGEHALVLLLFYRLILGISRQIKSLPLLLQLGKIALILLAYQFILFVLEAAHILSIHDIFVWILPILTSLILWPWVLFLLHPIAIRFYVHRL